MNMSERFERLGELHASIQDAISFGESLLVDSVTFDHTDSSHVRLTDREKFDLYSAMTKLHEAGEFISRISCE